MSTLLPTPLGAFLGTIGLAFIIGLELHAYRRRDNASLAPEALGFGTTRTVHPRVSGPPPPGRTA